MDIEEAAWHKIDEQVQLSAGFCTNWRRKNTTTCKLTRKKLWIGHVLKAGT